MLPARAPDPQPVQRSLRAAPVAVDHGRQHGAARAEERGVGDADAEAQPAATVADRHAEPLPRKIVGQDQRPASPEASLAALVMAVSKSTRKIRDADTYRVCAQ